MHKVLVIGEVMAELTQHGNHFTRATAGDIFNMAYYAKALLGRNAEICLYTALGRDTVSKQILLDIEISGVSPRLIKSSETKLPGLYLVEHDAQGERRFSYWRGQSAARQMLDGESEETLAETFSGFDIIYLSGITLAILPPDRRRLLLGVVASHLPDGTLVAFDPNFRPALWQDEPQVQEIFSAAYQAADIVFPGMEDEESLFGPHTIQEALHRFASCSNSHCVLKAGREGIFLLSGDQGADALNIPFTPVDNVVDTNAAGDSFAAGWLAGFLESGDPVTATRIAQAMASHVVSHKGAIVDCPHDALEKIRSA